MMIEYYRNLVELETADGIHIEVGSLFRRLGETLILVDDDLYFEFPFNSSLFYYIGIDVEEE